MSDSREPPPGGGLDPDAAIRGRSSGAAGPQRGPERVGGPEREGGPEPGRGPERGRGRGPEPTVEPDQAATAAQEQTEEVRWRLPPPVIDTRRYQWMIGLFGLALVIAFSIYLFVRGGNGTPGIAPGQHLHRFVAPLATSDLDASANANPHCDPAKPAARGLNVCDRQPTVLAFFALGAKPCIRQVDSLQKIAHRYPGVQIAAVAVNATRQATDKLVRQNHWTIPVAYDESGILGQVFGVEICPLVEIARAGGTVTRRLIGEHWVSTATLTQAIGSLGVK